MLITTVSTKTRWLCSLHHLISPCGNAWISAIFSFCRQRNFSDALCDLPKIAQLVNADGLWTRIPVLFLLYQTTSMPAASRIPTPSISYCLQFLPSVAGKDELTWQGKSRSNDNWDYNGMYHREKWETAWKSKNEKWISCPKMSDSWSLWVCRPLGKRGLRLQMELRLHIREMLSGFAVITGVLKRRRGRKWQL